VIRRTIIFHLGFQKTGTTSIQAMLNANAACLGNVDLRAYGPATQDLRTAGRRWCADPTRGRQARLESVLEDHVVRFRAGSAPVCLISDENILGRVPWASTGDILTWGRSILPMVESASKGLDLQIVFYTRSPSRWLRSLYNQSVKRARVTASFDTWAADAPFTVDWPRWQRDLQTTVEAPVTFVAMEDEIGPDRLLGATLLRLAGVTDETIAGIVPPPVQNTSLSPRAIALMRLVNRLPIRDRLLLKVSEAVERMDQSRISK
jgi:hypothetical protein